MHPLLKKILDPPLYNLRNLETDVALSRLKTNFLKRCFKYSGAMLWNNLLYEAKTEHKLFPNLKANLPVCLVLDRSDSIICMCVFFKLILITLRNSHQQRLYCSCKTGYIAYIFA